MAEKSIKKVKLQEHELTAREREIAGCFRNQEPKKKGFVRQKRLEIELPNTFKNFGEYGGI